MLTPSLSSAPLAPAAIPSFVKGGRALFTVVGKAARYTFKVTAPKRDRDSGEKIAPENTGTRWVSVLTGPDNESAYTVLGTMFLDGGGNYVHNTRKSPIGKDAPSAVAAEWFFKAVLSGRTLPPSLEVWHEGKCCRCGRTLTVPSSISNGVGPECLKKRAA